MALSFTPQRRALSPLSNLIDRCDRPPVLGDIERADEIADALRAVSSNPRLIPDFLVSSRFPTNHAAQPSQCD